LFSAAPLTLLPGDGVVVEGAVVVTVVTLPSLVTVRSLVKIVVWALGSLPPPLVRK
jgi:hypothetical protein